MPLSVDLLNSPDLLETTIGDVTRTSETSAPFPAPDTINVATRSNELEEFKAECETLKDDTEKLKQLETEQTILPSLRPTIDINVNSQVLGSLLCLLVLLPFPGRRPFPDHCLNLLSVTVIKTVTKSDLERNGFISSYSLPSS